MSHPSTFHLLSAVSDKPIPRHSSVNWTQNIADLKSFYFARSKYQGRVRIGPCYQTNDGQCTFISKASNGNRRELRPYLLALELSSKEMLNKNYRVGVQNFWRSLQIIHTPFLSCSFVSPANAFTFFCPPFGVICQLYKCLTLWKFKNILCFLALVNTSQPLSAETAFSRSGYEYAQTCGLLY